MQYILTQEEMNALQAKAGISSRMPSEKKLQEFCTKIADEFIVQEGWAKGRVWGCILTFDDSGNIDHYCDECPAKSVCPYPHKEWSQ